MLKPATESSAVVEVNDPMYRLLVYLLEWIVSFGFNVAIAIAAIIFPLHSQYIVQGPWISMGLDYQWLHHHKVRPSVSLSSRSTQPVLASSDERGPQQNSHSQSSSVWPM